MNEWNDDVVCCTSSCCVFFVSGLSLCFFFFLFLFFWFFWFRFVSSVLFFLVPAHRAPPTSQKHAVCSRVWTKRPKKCIDFFTVLSFKVFFK